MKKLIAALLAAMFAAATVSPVAFAADEPKKEQAKDKKDAKKKAATDEKDKK